MRLGRPVPELILSAEEQETLERWARRPTSAQSLALRARVILACAAGKTDAPADATQWSTRSMAKRCGLSQSAVSRIQRTAHRRNPGRHWPLLQTNL